ncbi:cyclopropane-fatty-acyl-phospholipid synthase, partial [Metarhizium majus ARSEF 297]
MVQEHAEITVPRTGLAALVAQLNIPGEVHFPGGLIIPVGNGPPSFKLLFRSDAAVRTPMTELGVGRAFIKGDIDIDGDIGRLFDARSSLKDKVPLRQKIQFLWDSIRSTTDMNTDAIGDHYSREDEFYLAFLDTSFRLYSHGLFEFPDDTIEQASQRKLETMFSELGLKQGMRLLDIGGGWGGVTQYCSARGVHVTTLTLAATGAHYVRRLISDAGLHGEVVLEDFFNHRPEQPYDHAVAFASIEHMPDYRRYARRVWDILKPGGRLYLDGSAAVEKYAVSSFARDYIWRGTHTFMTVQDVIAELLNHGFDLLRVANETRDYHLTMLEWSKRLDASKEAIIAGWGEEAYRKFRLFLWGGQHAFKVNSLQAYHLVVERTAAKGPRPSTPRRIFRALGELC